MRPYLKLMTLCLLTFIAVQKQSLAQGMPSHESTTMRWQHKVWHHVPIDIELPVGRERILHFPHATDLGIPPTLLSKLSIQKNNGWYYITAKEAFEPTNVEAKDTVTGDIIFMHVSASPHGSDTGIVIEDPQKTTENPSAKHHTDDVLSGEMAYVILTRFAEANLYGERRLLQNPYGIQLVTSFVNDKGQVPQDKWFYSLFLDSSTVDIPWAEWQGGDVYVTAVLVRNQLSVPLNLRQNLTVLCGRLQDSWQSVTFFPTWILGRSGQSDDTTTAFLVSKVPFDEAIQQCQMKRTSSL